MIRLALAVQADHARRGCADCAFLRGHVRWWCKNPKAVALRGTSIPGVAGCPEWEPAPAEQPGDARDWNVLVVRDPSARPPQAPRAPHDDPFAAEWWLAMALLVSGVACGLLAWAVLG